MAPMSGMDDLLFIEPVLRPKEFAIKRRRDRGRRGLSMNNKMLFRSLFPYSAISVVALLLTLPAIFAPIMTHDSFWIDFVWADQFTALLREGQIYPRWLPQSHDGLGAPIFYFYPPLAFYLTGVLGLGGLSTYASIITAFGVALAASGATMYLWLKGWTARPLLAALLFMAAPYHLLDFYRRGALAEFCAFALLPLVALGLRKAIRGEGFVLLAISYAAIILTHLPAALLTSLFIIGPGLLFVLLRRREHLMGMVQGVGLGIGLAATYLVPMLTLQDAVSIEKMISVPQYQAINWSLLTPELWPSRTGMMLAAGLCGAITLVSAAMLLIKRDMWAWASIGLCVIILGLVPRFWSLPLIANVQFPWRTLMLAEFAALTAFARTPLRPVIATLALLPMVTFSLVFLKPIHLAEQKPISELKLLHIDVIEYLPSGATAEFGWYSQWALDLARRHRSVIAKNGRAIAPHFYFPAWTVRCDGVVIRSFPDPTTKLLSWRGPPTCPATIETTRAEWIGLALSIGSLLALLLAMWRRKTS
jgi:hypothetical protein